MDVHEMSRSAIDYLAWHANLRATAVCGAAVLFIFLLGRERRDAATGSSRRREGGACQTVTEIFWALRTSVPQIDRVATGQRIIFARARPFIIINSH